jgi:F-type H+-transporting ATPase subunit b
MQETLRQLGGLLLGSVPTIILLALLTGLYKVLVHKPLMAILAERRSRTQGAVEKARADIASAEARTTEYEQRLREARTKVFKNQEARRQHAMEARAEAVAQARKKAQAHVGHTRNALETDKQHALVSLEQEAAKLATQIVRTVLRQTTPSAAGGR